MKAYKFKFEAKAPNGLVQLARTGSFYREDQGKFKVSKAMLLQMRDNAVERNLQIPIKLTHEREEYAAGWIACESLSVQPWQGGFGLFGKAMWTEEARNAIKQGAVKYLSPEIVWNAKRLQASSRGEAGEAVGPMLVGAALVLSPFFDMEPVSAYAREAKKLRLAYAAKGKTMHYSWMNLLGEEKLAALGEKLVAAGVDEKAAAGLAAEITLMMIREHVKEEEVEMPEGEMKEEEGKIEVEVELPASEDAAPMMQEELVEMGMKKDMQASEAPALAASLQRIAAAFGLKTTANTEQLVALASALKDAQNVNSKRLAALEAVEKKRQDAEAQELFARYSSESRFRSYSTAADPKGESYAKELLSKSGVEVFKTVFEPVAPLKGAAPAAPVSFSANSVSTTGKPFDVSPTKVMEYQTQHNIATYGEALKRILAAQK
jgi:hypothetical protein